MVKKAKSAKELERRKTRWISIAFVLAIGGLLSTVVGTILYTFVIHPYYEHKNRTRVTEERMQKSYESIKDKADQLGFFPPVKPTQKELFKSREGIAIDGWNQRMAYRLRKRYAELRSSGADKKMHTEDDLVITSREQPADFGSHPLGKDGQEKEAKN